MLPEGRAAPPREISAIEAQLRRKITSCASPSNARPKTASWVQDTGWEGPLGSEGVEYDNSVICD